MARPPKILAAAGNYQAHIVEGGAKPVDKSVIVPKLFMKPSSAVIAPGAPVPLSTVSNTVDWELELAVIIGRRGRDIPVERALDHVAGYTVINDISARTAEWGVAGRDPGEWDLFFDWLNGKWGDGYAPMGPWLVTTDDIPDPQALRMRLDVNGKTFQDAVTEDMIFSSAELIAFASRFMTLEPGDTFATGTPSGVGDSTGTYLKEGDVMEGWIEQIGTLVTPVSAPVRATAAV
jgi:2-keto-4-pentenoate hydratase/2-oxohepta-3-ene-1,7-dioic acid hydratase in catechol pathway